MPAKNNSPAPARAENGNRKQHPPQPSPGGPWSLVTAGAAAEREGWGTGGRKKEAGGLAPRSIDASNFGEFDSWPMVGAGQRPNKYRKFNPDFST
jgi:hypothetical protein